MIKVMKNKETMVARDDNQLAAFLNNGWTKMTVPQNENAEQQPEQEQKQYSKSDISRMNVENLKRLAADLEIENSDAMTGEALKMALVEKLGL